MKIVREMKEEGKEWLDDLCFVRKGEIIFASCTSERFNFMTQELSERFKAST